MYDSIQFIHAFDFVIAVTVVNGILIQFLNIFLFSSLFGSRLYIHRLHEQEEFFTQNKVNSICFLCEFGKISLLLSFAYGSTFTGIISKRFFFLGLLLIILAMT